MVRGEFETLNEALAKNVRLVAFDVDGVMTDAGVYMGVIGSERVELKKFSTQDSVGIKLLMATGITVALISGRVSGATEIRARELGITEVIQVADARKIPPLRALLNRAGIGIDQVAFVGDDLPDLAVMRIVGLPVAVGNAVAEIKEVAKLTTRRPGGDGAVREFAETLLKARGEWQNAVDRYVLSRSEKPHSVQDAC